VIVGGTGALLVVIFGTALFVPTFVSFEVVLTISHGGVLIAEGAMSKSSTSR